MNYKSKSYLFRAFSPLNINCRELRHLISNSLKEDIGARDITTDTFIPGYKHVKAVVIVKEDCVVCGLDIAKSVFKKLDKHIKFKALACDGDIVKKGRAVAAISGRAKGILTAERVALNFLSLLSGVATKTRKFVEALKPYKVKIVDTRKTIPGLRLLEKYAVRIGGGFNHRMRLDEMFLVKDNHLAVIGGLNRLNEIPKAKIFEVEVKSLKELRDALRLNPDIIMLDNMSLKDMNIAVAIRNAQAPNIKHPIPQLEASGGITLNNVKSVASCGVDIISVGALTNSVSCVDVSLEKRG